MEEAIRNLFRDFRELKNPNKTHTAILLTCAGLQVLELYYDQFKFDTEADKDDPAKVLGHLRDYCNHRYYEVLESFRFWNSPASEPL